jgi:hypothetical protein
MYDREKTLFLNDIQSKINGLNFQRERIFAISTKERFEKRISPVHDVDFYVIILRRLYRIIENVSSHDSRVANLKGRYNDLFKKIKIRDHFEHGVDIDGIAPTVISDLPSGTISGSDSSIRITTSIVNNVIISGNFKWDLNVDHEIFIKIIKEFITFFPFTDRI